MSGLTHVTVGTNDLEAARRFYDAVLEPLGIERTRDIEGRGSIWGNTFFVLLPLDGKPATHANGGTIGFQAPNREAINLFHANGLAAGGSNEGSPGPRSFAPNAYAAYLRDPDGNKIVASCIQAA